MRTDVTWVICCMDPGKLDLMMTWLNHETPGSLVGIERIVVVTTARNLHLQQSIRDVAAKHARGIQVRTDMNEAMMLTRIKAPLPLKTYFYESLGVKLMIPLTTFTPFIYTDDDFIIRRDPSYLCDEMFWGSTSGLDAYFPTDKDIEALAALNEAMGTNETMEEFNAIRTDAGAFYFPRLNTSDYITRLNAYFDHPHIHRVSVDPGVANGHTQRFRKLDQRFLSAYITDVGGFDLRPPHYRGMGMKYHPQRMPNSTMIHYCSSGSKEAYMAWFWQKWYDLQQGAVV